MTMLKRGDLVRCIRTMPGRPEYGVAKATYRVYQDQTDSYAVHIDLGGGHVRCLMAGRFEKVEVASDPRAALFGVPLWKPPVPAAAPKPEPVLDFTVPVSDRAFYIVVLGDPGEALQPASAPRVHGNVTSARLEAERLSKANPGRTFYVLRSHLNAHTPKPVEPSTTITVY